MQMPVGEANLFGLDQYNFKTSFFDPQDTILSQVRVAPGILCSITGGHEYGLAAAHMMYVYIACALQQHCTYGRDHVVQCSHMKLYALPLQGVGYGILVGFGAVFAIVTVGLVSNFGRMRVNMVAAERPGRHLWRCARGPALQSHRCNEHI